MSNEKLVELITKEVMIRLKAMLNNNDITNQKKVLVLEKSEDLCPVLTGALRENNYIVDSLDNMGNLSSYEGIILQSITNSELANLSNGIEGSIKEKVTIEAILSGSRIYSMEKGVQYSKFATTSNIEFFNLFKSYEEKLKTYGIAFVGLKKLLNCLGTKVHEVEKSTCNLERNEMNLVALTKECDEDFIDLTNKKLISEVELRNIYKSGINKVLVSKKAVITPLAMDFARVSKVQINRQ